MSAIDTCITGESCDFVAPHFRCPVILDGRVCSCECSTCKRAWFADGRPISVDGKIVRREPKDSWE